MSTVPLWFTNTADSDVRIDFEIEPDLDPVIRKAPYRLIVVDMYGNQYAEIENAVLGPMKWAINDKGSFTFSLGVDDAKAFEIQMVEREVQVWRGRRLMWWGVPLRGRSDGQTVDFQCLTVEWYFDRRLMGALPNSGVFAATGFQYGLGAWTKSWLPGTEPSNDPLAQISNKMSVSGGQSLYLASAGDRTEATYQGDDWFTTTNGDTLSATGESDIATIMAAASGSAPKVTFDVYHDNRHTAKEALDITQDRADAIAAEALTIKPDATIIATGMGEKHPVSTNETSGGRADNRRIEVSYRPAEPVRGHGQYLSQSYSITVKEKEKRRRRVTLRGWVYIQSFEGAAANAYGMVLERQDPTKPHKNPRYADAGYKKVYARKWQPISADSPRHRWIRMEVSMMVPSDGKTYVLEARIFPCSGVVYWDEVDLYVDGALNYVNEEQANMVRDLVDHAQDPDYGKSDLNIGRRVAKTGVKRTRRYSFAEHGVIGDHLNEFSTLGDGMEWDIVITPTKRTLRTYHPRKARKTDYRLVLGGNVSQASIDVDSTMLATKVLIMANDVEEYAREEKAVTDDSLHTVTLETAYLATPGTSISSLRAQARRGIERYRKPIYVPSVTTNPIYVREITRKVHTGTILHVEIQNEWYTTVSKHRVTEMSLNPSTDEYTLTLVPEDTKIKVIEGWEGVWKYKSTSQGAITGSSNTTPVENNTAYAAPSYDDSSWSSGQAGFGWFDQGDVRQTTVDFEPNTTITTAHEVWMRKQVYCTEEMYISVRCDAFAYVYVNGNLVRNRYFVGHNYQKKLLAGPQRVPDEFLDPSGVQTIAIHAQAELALRPDDPCALYLDAKVRGIYDPEHVS